MTPEEFKQARLAMLNILPNQVYDYMDHINGFYKEHKGILNLDKQLKEAAEVAYDEFTKFASKTLISIDNLHDSVRVLHRIIEKANDREIERENRKR